MDDPGRPGPLLRAVLRRALRARASVVQLCPGPGGVRLRARIGGRFCEQYPRPPADVGPRLLAEARGWAGLPGRGPARRLLSLRREGEREAAIHLSVSSHPNPAGHGENWIVILLLDPSQDPASARRGPCVDLVEWAGAQLSRTRRFDPSAPLWTDEGSMAVISAVLTAVGLNALILLWWSLER